MVEMTDEEVDEVSYHQLPLDQVEDELLDQVEDEIALELATKHTSSV